MRAFLLIFISTIFLWADAHIFIYHRFNDARYPTTSVTDKDLNKHFNYLKDNNYTVVPLKKLIDKIESNETIPDKWIAIAIDDGYKSFTKSAFEVFKQFNYPFTMFVYVEATNKKYSDFLTWEELLELMPYGDVQFHSYAHPNMARLSDDELRADFKKGIDIFEKKMGYKPIYFSYPYGEFKPETVGIVKEFGFKAIFNQNNGAVNSQSDLFNLDRSAIVGSVNLKKILDQRVLKTKWESPVRFPKDGNLTKVVITVDSKAKKGELYITALGWRYVNIENGVINEEINEKLKNSRTRIILKIGNQVSTKILAKE